MSKTNNALNLPTFIPLPQAAKQTGLSVKKLTRLVEAGRIAAAQLPTGEIVVSRRDANSAVPTPKEELEEYKKHAHLRGQGIGIGEAARRYKIPHQTVSRWVKHGYIARLGQDGQKVLIDEADIAYCAEIYRQRGGQGKRLFDDAGRPYQLKYPDLAKHRRQGNRTPA